VSLRVGTKVAVFTGKMAPVRWFRLCPKLLLPWTLKKPPG
jgi:hypothetical protein